MSDKKPNPLLRPAAVVLKSYDAHKGNAPACVSPEAIAALRAVVIAEAPHCTPEQIANGECPTA